MSKQHVFPNRLQRVLPRIPGDRQLGSYSVRRKAGKTLQHVETVKQRPGSIGTSQVRKVCKACNGGWLRSMEEDCFPLIEQLITGELSVLTPADQTKIARVATSMAMAGEWLHSDYVATTQTEREMFRENLEPPPNWYVFIGRNGAGSGEPRFGSNGVELVGGAPDYASFTMTTGPVLLHLVATGPTMTFFDPVLYGGMFQLVPICPATEVVTFPLLPALGAAQIVSLRTYLTAAHRQFVEGR